MKQPAKHKMDSYRFPRQKVLCDNKPFSRELLHSLLETVYTASPPFTGYINIIDGGSSHYFLFFFNGAPYSAGRHADGKPVSYSIRELGKHLAAAADETMSVSLCETDPILLKSMLLFLQEEPDIKAPTTLIDIEYIVRQIGEVGSNAMIALCRDKNINFFFFKNGKGALVHYSDPAFAPPEGMTVDEEMLLYAFQPGEKVQAFVFRDMLTTMADESDLLDMDLLYKLLITGNPEDRRGADTKAPSMPAGNAKNRRRGDNKASLVPAAEGVKALVEALRQKPKLPGFIIAVESGPMQGERFTVTLPCTIGRKGCDLILDDHRISRRHAELKIIDDKLIIEDLGSTNGTKVNGEKITSKRLIPKDLVSIGPINLTISPA